MIHLEELVGGRRIWPAIKANAYGHGAELVARHLVSLGYDTLCVAHVTEGIAMNREDLIAIAVVRRAYSNGIRIHGDRVNHWVRWTGVYARWIP